MVQRGLLYRRNIVTRGFAVQEVKYTIAGLECETLAVCCPLFRQVIEADNVFVEFNCVSYISHRLEAIVLKSRKGCPTWFPWLLSFLFFG